MKLSSPFVAAMLLSIQPAIAGTVSCRITPPVEFGAAPAQWLGACPHGVAEGLGVIRSGSGEPFEFFTGEARAGRPVRGLLITHDGWFAAANFDASMKRRDIM